MVKMVFTLKQGQNCYSFFGIQMGAMKSLGWTLFSSEYGLEQYEFATNLNYDGKVASQMDPCWPAIRNGKHWEM